MVQAISRANVGAVWSWLKKGCWSVLDQGLFAASNFVLTVLLARWLSPQDFGAFVTVFAVFLLLISTVHTGLINEPMLVFGSSRYESRFSEYLGSLLYAHLGFAVLSSFSLLLISLGLTISGASELAMILVAMALAEPFILLLWLMRRACYVRFEPSLAASGGALYMALMLAGAYALYRLEWLSPVSAFGIMALSSLLVSLWLVVRLHVKWLSFRDELIRATLKDHWRYGRWATPVQMLQAFPEYVCYLALPIWFGLEASASFKALMNLIMPVLMAYAALAILLIPTFARVRESANFGTLIRLTIVFFVFGALLWWLCLGLFHNQILAWLYGGRYTEGAELLWLLGVLPVVEAARLVLGSALRVLERTDLVFWAQALATTVVLILGLPMISEWGISGAAVGLLATYVVDLAILGYLFATRTARS